MQTQLEALYVRREPVMTRNLQLENYLASRGWILQPAELGDELISSCLLASPAVPRNALSSFRPLILFFWIVLTFKLFAFFEACLRVSGWYI